MRTTSAGIIWWPLAFFAVVIAAIFLIGDNDGGDLPASA